MILLLDILSTLILIAVIAACAWFILENYHDKYHKRVGIHIMVAIIYVLLRLWLM